MTQSPSSFNNKPPDPTLSTSLSKSSLTSSTASLSPSASVLLSAASNRYRRGQQPSPTMTLSSSSTTIKKSTKLEQIIQNFYTKTAQIIIQSRIARLNSNNSSGKKKLNKWFNITTHDNEELKKELRFWKSSVENYQHQELSPLIIHIYLETTEPDLLQEGDDMHGWHRLDLGVQQRGDKQRILIESWSLSLNHPVPDYPVDLPNLYKRSIVFFRSLHSLVRALPSYSLYQRLGMQNSEISLGYRLSDSNLQRKDEVSFEHTLKSNDLIQAYEFKEIATPMGTFQLKLSYRAHCQFDTKEESSLQRIDIEENYFTPTMTKYKLERSKETKGEDSASTRPFVSRTPSARERLQSYRGTAATPTVSRSTHPVASSSSSTTASTERRISTPLVSPFKSPSLSSSPQAELMYPSRSHTPDSRSRQTSGSFSRKPEFSSSFEKFYKGSSNNSSSSQIHRTGSSNNVTADMSGISMTRRWSRTSDHSSINLELDEEDEDLKEFVRLVTARQELNLFQQHAPQPDFQKPDNTEDDKQQRSESEAATKSLSHFRNLQETHNVLSDSMTFSQYQFKQQQPSASTTTYSYESSQSSLSKGPNLPTIPSPLHTTELAIHPTTIIPSISAPIPRQQIKQTLVNTHDDFFNFSHGDRQRHYPLTPQQADIVISSPLKNRQAPPLPPPPKMPVRQQRISTSGGIGSSSGGSGLDDEHPLMFNMGDLSGHEENSIHTTNATNSSGHVNNTFYYSAAAAARKEDYLQRLKMASELNEDTSGMRRALSTGASPRSHAAIESDSDGSSKSDPMTCNTLNTLSQKQGTKITRRLFYGES